MDLVSPFAADWLQRLLDESQEEARENAQWPILPLSIPMRKLVWRVTAIFGVNNRGVPGNTCRVMERYLAFYLREYTSRRPSPEEWERFKDQLAKRFCLLLVSCIQLVAKMSNLSVALSIEFVRSVLLLEGYEHAKAEIRDAEFHVFKTLNFRIPVWTSLETAELLAMQAGLSAPHLLEAVGLVIDITDFNHPHIVFNMQFWGDGSTTPGTSSTSMSNNKIRHVDICAGAVLAAGEYMNVSTHHATHKLATLIGAAFAFLRAIAKFILSYLTERRYIPILRKRKLSLND